MAFHMEAEHDRQCKWLSTPMGFYVCPLCRFESNTTKQFQRHKLKCEKQFRMVRNLEPVPTDCDIPIKPLFKPRPQNPMLAPANRNAIRPQAKVSVTTLRPLSTITTIRPQTFKEKSVGNILARSQAPMIISNKVPIQPARPQITQMQRLALPAQPAAGGQSPQIVQIQGNLYSLFYAQGQAYLTPVAQGNVASVPAGQILAQPLNLQPRQTIVPRPLQSTQTLQSQQNTNAISNLIAARAIAQAAAGKALSNKTASLVKTSVKNVNADMLKEKLSATAVFPKEPVQGFEICEICGGLSKIATRLEFIFTGPTKLIFRNQCFEHTNHILFVHAKLTKKNAYKGFGPTKGFRDIGRLPMQRQKLLSLTFKLGSVSCVGNRALFLSLDISEPNIISRSVPGSGTSSVYVVDNNLRINPNWKIIC